MALISRVLRYCNHQSKAFYSVPYQVRCRRSSLSDENSNKFKIQNREAYVLSYCLNIINTALTLRIWPCDALEGVDDTLTSVGSSTARKTSCTSCLLHLHPRLS